MSPLEQGKPSVGTVEDAFAALDAHGLRRCYALAGYLLGDAVEAEDATQDAMARAWRSRRSLRDIATFEAWLDRIVVNVCRDRMRRRRIVRFVPIETGSGSTDADPFRSFLARDEIGRSMAVLTPDQRIVVVLRYWFDLPLDQIAERLGWPLGTVKSRLHHAQAALRSRLERA